METQAAAVFFVLQLCPNALRRPGMNGKLPELYLPALFLVMNLHAVQHLDKAGVAVVDNFAVAKVQLGNLRHIFLAELEIPNVDVLFGICDYHFLHFYLVLGAPCVMIKEDGICRK